jgi:hypothetical protein
MTARCEKFSRADKTKMTSVSLKNNRGSAKLCAVLVGGRCQSKNGLVLLGRAFVADDDEVEEDAELEKDVSSRIFVRSGAARKIMLTNDDVASLDVAIDEKDDDTAVGLLLALDDTVTLLLVDDASRSRMICRRLSSRSQAR